MACPCGEGRTALKLDTYGSGSAAQTRSDTPQRSAAEFVFCSYTYWIFGSGGCFLDPSVSRPASPRPFGALIQDTVHSYSVVVQWIFGSGGCFLGRVCKPPRLAPPMQFFTSVRRSSKPMCNQPPSILCELLFTMAFRHWSFGAVFQGMERATAGFIAHFHFRRLV